MIFMRGFFISHVRTWRAKFYEGKLSAQEFVVLYKFLCLGILDSWWIKDVIFKLIFDINLVRNLDIYYHFTTRFVDYSIRQNYMAEAVKNNSRKRRPPTHFDQGYNQDNFQPRNPHSYASREQNKQGTEVCTMNTLAKLLTKFVNSANKRNQQARTKRKQQEIASSQKKPATTQQKNVSKAERAPKQERSVTSVKVKQGAELSQVQNRQEPSRTHQRAVKKLTNSVSPSPIAQPKNSKTQPQNYESLIKNILPTGNPLNVQSMAKVNQEQYLKLISKGTVDANIFKNQLINPSDPETLRNLGRLSQSLMRQSMRANQFRQDTKLFKRASFHIGIAYNIHIENVKKKNPNYTPQDLDPTSVSRRMKQQNSQQSKRQIQQRQKIRVQQELLRQRQLIQANAAKQRRGFQQINRNQLSGSIKSTPQKQPICIDLQDDQQGQNSVKAQKQQIPQVETKVEKTIEQNSSEKQYQNLQKNNQNQNLENLINKKQSEEHKNGQHEIQIENDLPQEKIVLKNEYQIQNPNNIEQKMNEEIKIEEGPIPGMIRNQGESTPKPTQQQKQNS